MKIILLVLWVLSVGLYFRSSFLAQGKSFTKIAKKESFLLWQKTIGVLLGIGFILSIVFYRTFFPYLFAANLLILFLFYLQPTPRTTRALLWIFILTNIALALIYFF